MDLVTILGLIAATCTTFSFIPQAIKTIKTKNTSGLSLSMYSIFTAGILFWLIYGIVINDLPIIVANAITLIFSATILFFIFRYQP